MIHSMYPRIRGSRYSLTISTKSVRKPNQYNPYLKYKPKRIFTKEDLFYIFVLQISCFVPIYNIANCYLRHRLTYKEFVHMPYEMSSNMVPMRLIEFIYDKWFKSYDTNSD